MAENHGTPEARMLPRSGPEVVTEKESPKSSRQDITG